MGAGAVRESRCEMSRGRERERDGEKRAHIVEITRMASRGVSDHLIRHNISSRRINSKIAIVENDISFFHVF